MEIRTRKKETSWYKILDILYQNNGKGEYMTSKIGEKYDERRGHTVVINEEFLDVGGGYVLKYVGEPGYIHTTPFIKLECVDVENNIYHFITRNSIYVLQRKYLPELEV